MRDVARALADGVASYDVLHRHLSVGGLLHAGCGIVIYDAFLHHWFRSTPNVLQECLAGLSVDKRDASALVLHDNLLRLHLLPLINASASIIARQRTVSRPLHSYYLRSDKLHLYIRCSVLRIDNDSHCRRQK